MPQSSKAQEQLKLLFETRMQYQEGLEAITYAEGKVGGYLGSGKGAVAGDHITGEMHWDLYEDIAGDVCQTNFAGEIYTEDGATITFDARGFGLVPDPSKAHEWRMSYAVRFNTDDERYTWLQKIIGLWDGEFDMNTYLHHYQVYVRSAA